MRPTLSALDRAAPTFPAPIGAGSRIPPPLSGVPARSDQVDRLRHGDEFDVLVVGGGSVGAGVALDAQTRGLSVACIERGDFASETSSRSTKLLWAGIRYLATAAAGLLRTTNFSRPLEALEDFRAEIAMVLNCHRERRYMIEQQPHLCHWIPIALPFTSLKVDPPPFGHPLFGFFPVLAPLVFKVYDAMSSFSCPPPAARAVEIVWVPSATLRVERTTSSRTALPGPRRPSDRRRRTRRSFLLTQRGRAGRTSWARARRARSSRS